MLASQEILGNCGLFPELGLGKTMIIDLEETLLKLPRSTSSSGYRPYWSCWRNHLANYNSHGIVPLSRCSVPFMVSDERLLWHLRLAFAHQLAAAERCKVSHVLPDHIRCGKPDERVVSGLPAGLVQQGYNLWFILHPQASRCPVPPPHPPLPSFLLFLFFYIYTSISTFKSLLPGVSAAATLERPGAVSSNQLGCRQSAQIRPAWC